jgi:hypothetical protein
MGLAHHRFSFLEKDAAFLNLEEVRTLYTSIYRPVWRLRTAIARNPLFRYWQELEDTQWLSQVELERLQLARLQRLLHHAYQHVPFYRRRLEEVGLHPDDVHSLADLRRLPVLTRDDVRQHLAELVARDVPRQGLLLNATGGSTGQPVSFYQDQTYQTYNVAAKLRYRRWYGFQRGDKVAFLWGQPGAAPGTMAEFVQCIVGKDARLRPASGQLAAQGDHWLCLFLATFRFIPERERAR